jgi:hypothetical protein
LPAGPSTPCAMTSRRGLQGLHPQEWCAETMTSPGRWRAVVSTVTAALRGRAAWQLWAAETLAAVEPAAGMMCVTDSCERGPRDRHEVAGLSAFRGSRRSGGWL